MIVDILRDQVWQGVAVIISFVSLILTIIVDRERIIPVLRYSKRKSSNSEDVNTYTPSALAIFLFGVFVTSLLLLAIGVGFQLAKSRSSYVASTPMASTPANEQQTSTVSTGDSTIYLNHIVISLDKISQGEVYGTIGAPGCVSRPIEKAKLGYFIVYICNQTYDVRLIQIQPSWAEFSVTVIK